MGACKLMISLLVRPSMRTCFRGGARSAAQPWFGRPSPAVKAAPRARNRELDRLTVCTEDEMLCALGLRIRPQMRLDSRVNSRVYAESPYGIGGTSGYWRGIGFLKRPAISIDP